MKHDVILTLDALNLASEKLLVIQGIMSNEHDIRAIKQLMSLSIEYLTQLNLILLKDAKEIENDQFKIRLVVGAVKGFIDDIQDMKVSLNTRHLSRTGVAL